MSSTVKYSLAIVLFLVLGFGIVMYIQFEPSQNQIFESQIVSLDDGFGYKILRGEKIVIVQEFVPGLPGKQQFVSKEEAQKTANLVLSKLEEGKSPILLPTDLAKLNISTQVGH
ncbi:MAG: DUF4907 domain-containing protein [Maribacter dokdonensis]|uniref:DUF4907 domain-containing protein n=1 Tax=Maribacter dokdonensis TaxID=320912 RepID=UPI0032991FCF